MLSKMGFFFLLSVLSLSVFASESAYRDLDTDYSVYEKKALGKTIYQTSGTINGGSAHSNAKIYNEETLPQPTGWNSQFLQQRFELLRDEKFIDDGTGNLRRPSWNYPDDGCFARAAMVNRTAFQKFMPVPSKVFAFGNLRVETKNSPRGKVGWWYHVAAIVRVGQTKYVLDPAIEPSQPLPLNEWLSRMGDPARIKVSICESGTYSPGDSCRKETDGLELRAYNTQKHFLSLERNRLKTLGRENEL